MSDVQEKEKTPPKEPTTCPNNEIKSPNNKTKSPNNETKSPNSETKAPNGETSEKKLPTKALKIIFKSLPGKELYRHRAVCKQWKKLIDEISTKDDRWRKYSKKDFKEIYKLVHKNAPDLSWFDLYKSMNLWSKLTRAKVNCRLFTTFEDEDMIEHFQIFDNKIGILINDCINYYDLKTMQKLDKRDYNDIFSKYQENDKVVAVINIYTSRLLVCPKTGEFNRSINFQDEFLEVEQNVKNFVLVDLSIYYVTENGDISVCKITEDAQDAEKTFIKQFEGNVLALSYTNHLNILTDQYEIYSLSNNDFKLQYSYRTSSSLFTKLCKYNFLDLKWKDVYRFIATKHVEDSLVDVMWNISAMKAYGKLLFVGTEFGNLAVYQVPSNNELNLSTTRPIKEFDLDEFVKGEQTRNPHAMNSFAPPDFIQKIIVHIDVVEVKDGHDVYVATVNNVIVMEFRHGSKRSALEADLQDNNVKQMKT